MTETRSPGRRISYDDCLSLLDDLVAEAASATPASLKLLSEQREIEWQEIIDGQACERRLRLPLVFPPVQEDETLREYLPRVPLSPPRYVVLLIQAGSASLGLFEDGEVLFHKVIKKYMVRKKQGKAQVTYLNQKGKSRLGSRIRLQQTVEFFEEINEYLCDWLEDDDSSPVFVSCPVRLWVLLLRSKVPPPFGKRDPRLRRIPLHVHTPGHEELLRIHEQLLVGWLFNS